MANMMADAATWLVDQLQASLSQTVSLTRGSTAATSGVAATKCPVKTPIDLQFGVLRVNECDWIIEATAYVIGGSQVEPQKNDLITESGGDVWQVLAPFDGEDSHKPLDPQVTAWRIHTKRVTNA